MPCYSAWYEFLKPDSPEYRETKARVEAKLSSVQHIVDYYYSTHNFKLPELPRGTDIDPFRQPRSKAELKLREMICHHFACDGVNFCTLYDVCTLLSEQDDEQRSYLAVIMPCATLMRQDKEKYPSNWSKNGNALKESGDAWFPAQVKT